ncbi:MAG: 50S ribosomal protein L25 [Armatimonadota bacterium]
MSEQLTLQLKTRAGMGSNAVKKYRREGMAPGIVYGHSEPLAVLTDAHNFRMTVPVDQYGSQVVRITVDDKDAGSALVKGVQINTVTRQILNIDFQRVSLEDRINVSVSLVAEGESPDVKQGAMLEQFLHSVSLRCSAFEVPSQIVVDISGMHVGDSLHAADLPLPVGCELNMSPEEVILLITAPRGAEIVEVEATPTETEATGPAATAE